MELAIDTSTAFAGIGLSHEGEILAEMTWHAGQNHTVQLMPNISYMLNQMKVSNESLNAIFVARGPGSFNGLRVGMSTAKGLAFALNIPLVGISTLEIEAYPFAFTKLPLYPIHNVGRNEIATATYRQEDNWTRIKEEHITTADVLCQQIVERALFCGEIPEPVIQQLQERLGDLAIIPDSISRLRHASHLASLGWQQLANGNHDNPASLQPLYLRQPHITQRKAK